MVQAAGHSNLAFNGTFKINADKKAVEKFVRDSEKPDVACLSNKLMELKTIADQMPKEDTLHISIKERDGVPGDIRLGVRVQVSDALSEAYSKAIKILGPDKYRSIPNSTFSIDGIVRLSREAHSNIYNKITTVRPIMNRALDDLKEHQEGLKKERPLLSPEEQDSTIKLFNEFIDIFS